MIKTYIIKHRGKLAVLVNDGKSNVIISTGLPYTEQLRLAYRRLLLNTIDLIDPTTIDDIKRCIKLSKKAIILTLCNNFEAVYSSLYTLVKQEDITDEHLE